MVLLIRLRKLSFRPYPDGAINSVHTNIMWLIINDHQLTQVVLTVPKLKRPARSYASLTAGPVCLHLPAYADVRIINGAESVVGWLAFLSSFRRFYTLWFFEGFPCCINIVTYDAKFVCLCVHILHFLYRLHVNQTTLDFQADNDLRCRILCRRHMNMARILPCFYSVFLFSGTIPRIYLLFPDDVPHQMTFCDRWHWEATCLSYRIYVCLSPLLFSFL